MRYYEPRYPEVDEVVMVQVRQIAEMGAYVKLLEYDGIEGMILLSELSRRRIRSIQKLIRVGRNEVVVVLRVDKEKGYIDLSKRRVSAEELKRCEDRFNKSRAVMSILRHVASRTSDADMAFLTPAGQTPAVTDKTTERGEAADEDGAPAAGSGEERRLEQLYEQFAWPLGRQFGHPLDAFKVLLTEPDQIFASLPVQPSPAVRQQLTTMIARKLTPQPVKVRADVDVKCSAPAGIFAIKKALKAGEKMSSELVPIKVRLVAPPLYVLETNSTDKAIAIDRLERAIQAIQDTIQRHGGTLAIKRSPKAVSEAEDQDLKQLMAKADAENAEVAGDEDYDDAMD